MSEDEQQPPPAEDKRTDGEKRIDDLEEKVQRGIDNLEKITEAEAMWVERHKELMQRFKQRMCSQGDMESFISDQIVEKLEVVAQLESKIDEKKEHLSKLKLNHREKKEDNLVEHKRSLRSLNEEKRLLENRLEDEQNTKFNRDKLSVNYMIVQRRLAEEKVGFQDSIQEFESSSTRDIDRLIRKEMIRNQGAKGAYKEQLVAEKRKSGAKATQDYVENLTRIKKTGNNTIAVLEYNERLMKQQHDLKHELDVQKLAAERAKKCNEELERHLKQLVQKYFDTCDEIEETHASSTTKRVDKDFQMRQVKHKVADSKEEAEVLRLELRHILETSEWTKQETRSTRQDAHDMFGGDSVAWAITAALPAIRSKSDDEMQPSRLMETDDERNENDLELLLSALHLSSRRDQSDGHHTPRHGLHTSGSFGSTARSGFYQQ